MRRRGKPWAVVYEELRRLAQAQLARESQGHSLHTPLTYKAYEWLVGMVPAEWANRQRFFAATAETVRRAFVDDACY